MKSEKKRDKRPKSDALYAFDKDIISSKNCMIAGVDEAGRGAFAGPVIACAVCLDYDTPIDGINDSKKLTEIQRQQLYEQIVATARGWAVGSASCSEVDKYNVLEATYLAMKRALEGLACQWECALIDGNRSVPYIPENRQMLIVKGDANSASIAAASIIAKVTRDRLMVQAHEQYPHYDFMTNKGYGTLQHRNSIIANGLCGIHRRSFCEDLVLQTRLEF
ncbi:MAG: ribonuclease HII [Chitinispirillaceae bacterium]|nr:ribonuclease HII [Chitinispirillaceae bacterium]